MDELLESCWCYLSNVRLEKVENFHQTFLTILWGKSYHLFLKIFPPNFHPYFFSLWFYLNQKQKKKTFPIFFLYTKFSKVQTEPKCSDVFPVVCLPLLPLPPKEQPTSSFNFFGEKEKSVGIWFYITILGDT